MSETASEYVAEAELLMRRAAPTGLHGHHGWHMDEVAVATLLATLAVAHLLLPSTPSEVGP